MTSVSIQQVQKIPSTAELYLARLKTILADYDQRYGTVQQPQVATLSRLRTDLSAAANAYEQARQTNAPAEILIARKADLLWQCNQCDYYLNRPHAKSTVSRQNASSKRDRSLWQIRLAVMAAFQFKLLTYVRRLMPGANTTGLAWQDIVPGLRLCLLAFPRGH